MAGVTVGTFRYLLRRALRYDAPAAFASFRAQINNPIRRFPNDPQFVRAAFYRALANFQAGQKTNALVQMTNLLARFPKDLFAIRAQDWTGDFFYGIEDFAQAEKHYQLLYHNTNWSAGEFRFQALFKAGKAAYRRLSYDNAIGYFTNLINDPACPPALIAESYFAYGDTLTSKPTGDLEPPLENHRRAIVLFSRIPQQFPTNPIAARAWGRIADCYFQLGSIDPRNYRDAITNYQKVVDSPLAEVSTRSQAEVGLGNAMLRLAQLAQAPEEAGRLHEAALVHYLNVVYGVNLREGEMSDPLWVKEAGLAAGKVAESQRHWSQAIQLYKRLVDLLPPLRPTMEKNIAFAQRQLASQKK